MKRIGTWALVFGIGATVAPSLVWAQQEQPQPEAKSAGDVGAAGKLSMKELPMPVQNTLQKESKGGSIEGIKQEADQKGNTFYSAEIIKGDKGTNISVAPDGKVLSKGGRHGEAKEGGY